MAAVPGKARQQTIRFDEFELDLPAQTLVCRGVRTKLQKQPFQVLELLIQRAPAIVSRDEIRRHVWGEAVHIDATQSINFCIRQIRLALRETAAGPRFIETLPRQGYRFIAQLEGVPEKTLIPESLPNHGLPSRPKRQWLMLGLAAVVVLTVLAAVWRLPGRNTASGVVRIRPVTTYPGDEREPTISPDGRQVAFSWGGEKGGNRDIYVTLLGNQHAVRLTSDPAEDVYPAWSPNGEHIVFIRRRAGARADIITIPAVGGPERKLREIRLGAWLSTRVLAWSPDGKWLCFTDEIGAVGHHVLFLLSMDSGIVKELLPEEENGIGDSSPAFSPDGRWLAFARFEQPFNSKLLVQRLSPDLMPQGAPITVKDAGVNPTSPVWMPNEKKILFLDRFRIMEAKIGAPARSFYVSASTFGELTLARPSLRLVASLQDRHEEIWTITLGEKGLKALGNPQRILESSAGDSQPRFSPDGSSLAFASKRSGSSEVWVADSDGRNPRQLTHLSFYIAGYLRWSPDGQFLAFHARLPKDPQIYIVRVGDGLVKQVMRGKPGFKAPSWSMDGRSLYGSVLEDGKDRTHVLPLTGGLPRFLKDPTL